MTLLLKKNGFGTALVLSLAVSSAHAAVIEGSFSGTTTNPGEVGSLSFGAGQAVTGTFSYDSVGLMDSNSPYSFVGLMGANNTTTTAISYNSLFPLKITTTVDGVTTNVLGTTQSNVQITQN